jgi:phage terminase Nu1 subunit (DNA packaging protein)
MPKPKSKLTLTVNAAAAEFGVTRETLTRALNQAGIPKKDSYTIKAICAGLYGDIRSERLRLTRAKADREEIHVERARETLMPVEETQAVFNRVMAMIRQQFLALPGIAQAVNPSDAKHAHSVLREWSDGALKTCRDFKLTA